MASVERTTHRAIVERSLQGLQANLTRMGRLQEQLSSGKQIVRASDDPIGTSSAMLTRSEIRQNQQWSRNADDGLGWLAQMDSTLTGMITGVNRARDLTLQGMSTGSMSAESRNAMAAEIDQIRASLLSDANAQYNGRPLFGGTTTSATAYDPSGAYLGDATPVRRTVGAGVSVRVDLTGPEAFGPAGADLFATLQQISNDLRTNPSALSGDLGNLDGVASSMRNALGDVGARYNRIEQSRQTADDRVGALRNALAEIESIDLPETIMQLQLADTSYQAALAATGRAVKPSLLDFLR